MAPPKIKVEKRTLLEKFHDDMSALAAKTEPIQREIEDMRATIRDQEILLKKLEHATKRHEAEGTPDTSGDVPFMSKSGSTKFEHAAVAADVAESSHLEDIAGDASKTGIGDHHVDTAEQVKAP